MHLSVRLLSVRQTLTEASSAPCAGLRLAEPGTAGSCLVMVKVKSPFPFCALLRQERTHMATSSQPCELSDTRIIKRREETCPGRAGAEDGTGHPVPTGHSALSEKGRLGEAGRSWARGRPPPWAPGRPQWEPGSLRVCGRAGGSRGHLRGGGPSVPRGETEPSRWALSWSPRQGEVDPCVFWEVPKASRRCRGRVLWG